MRHLIFSNAVVMKTKSGSQSKSFDQYSVPWDSLGLFKALNRDGQSFLVRRKGWGLVSPLNAKEADW
jgi:hypothetical protein